MDLGRGSRTLLAAVLEAAVPGTRRALGTRGGRSAGSPVGFEPRRPSSLLAETKFPAGAGRRAAGTGRQPRAQHGGALAFGEREHFCHPSWV